MMEVGTVPSVHRALSVNEKQTGLNERDPRHGGIRNFVGREVDLRRPQRKEAPGRTRGRRKKTPFVSMKKPYIGSYILAAEKPIPSLVSVSPGWTGQNVKGTTAMGACNLERPRVCVAERIESLTLYRYVARVVKSLVSQRGDVAPCASRSSRNTAKYLRGFGSPCRKAWSSRRRERAQLTRTLISAALRAFW